MKFIVVTILLLFLPSIAGADLFTPPPTDKSVDLLGHILGTSVGAVHLGGQANPALMHMFEILNAVVMAIATMIVSYIGVISTLNTAQEGQVMGKKWSSMWIPMRAILGMMVIVPTPTSGYSVIQTIVMWCIMQGVGAADMVWNRVLMDLNFGVSAATAISRPADNDSHAARIYQALELIGADLAEPILRSAVCMQTIQQMNAGTAKQPAGGFRTPKENNVHNLGSRIQLYETVSNNNINDSQQATYSGTLRVGIPGNTEFADVCGKYEISGTAKRAEWEGAFVSDDDIKNKAEEIYHYKIFALRTIFEGFAPIASDIVQEEVLPRDTANNRLISMPENPLQPGGYKNRAITAYRETMKYMVKPLRVLGMQDIVQEGTANGWLSAGSFYFTLNEHHEIDYFDDIMVAPTISNVPSCDTFDTCSNYNPAGNKHLTHALNSFLQFGPEISYMGTRLWDSKVYMDHDVAMISERLLLKTANSTPRSALQQLQADMLNLLNTMMSEQHHDPLIAQGRFGASIMLLSERAWLDVQNKMQTTLNRAEQGYMPLTTELMNQINNLSHRGALAVAIYSIVWVIGATLAIYVPLIPYMIFTVGVIGWLLLVVEAIVAAPILAISFILPAGDELGKVVQGLLLLLNIMLRPLLMLFGFILSIRLYQAAVKLVNFGMLANFDMLNTGDSLFAWVAVLTLYGAFIIALSNKCFSLIYGLPDKILRWMGGAPEHTDASHELHEAKSTMLKGADTVNKVSMGIPERNFARLQARAKQLFPPDAVNGG